jgi:hypothetical protein
MTESPYPWTAAELTDLEDRLDRPLPLRGIHPIEEVRLRHGRIEFLNPPLFVGRDRIVPGPKLLTAFVRLSDAPEGKILEYARRWGPLGLCKHNTPFIHNWASPLPEDACGPRLVLDLDLHDIDPSDLEEVRAADWYWEPIDSWRGWARSAREIINLAAKTHLGELVDPEDWKSPFFKERTISGQRLALTRAVNYWLQSGEVRPYLEWRGEVIRITLDGFGLWGAIATQLAFAASRTNGLAICSSCGKPYIPNRRRAIARRNYCSQCSLRAAWT